MTLTRSNTLFLAFVAVLVVAFALLAGCNGPPLDVASLGLTPDDAITSGIGLAGIGGMVGRRELWIGTPSTGVGSDSGATATMTANEDLSVDLTRLVIGAGIDTAAIIPTLDASPYVGIESWLLKGSDQWTVGRGSNLEMAASIFATHHDFKSIIAEQLGTVVLESDDTIAWDLLLQGTNLSAACAVAAPCQAAKGGGLAADMFTPRGRPMFLKPERVDVDSGTTEDLVFTADKAGYTNLSDLVLLATSDEAAEAEGGSWVDGLPAGMVVQITMPNNQTLLRGKNTPVVPAWVYAGCRSKNWIDHGGLKLSAGSTVTVKYLNNGPDTIALKGLLPYWPEDQVVVSGRC